MISLGEIRVGGGGGGGGGAGAGQSLPLLSRPLFSWALAPLHSSTLDASHSLWVKLLSCMKMFLSKLRSGLLHLCKVWVSLDGKLH